MQNPRGLFPGYGEVGCVGDVGACGEVAVVVVGDMMSRDDVRALRATGGVR